MDMGLTGLGLGWPCPDVTWACNGVGLVCAGLDWPAVGWPCA
jgi:hypothetical protein